MNVRECSKVCMNLDVSCPNSDCRMWLDCEEDYNCVLITIHKNDENPMTLREIAPKMKVTFPRIAQIEAAAFEKMKKILPDCKD